MITGRNPPAAEAIDIAPAPNETTDIASNDR
jgi:hypothetical protein